MKRPLYGKNLSYLRKLWGMSQYQLANKLNISRSTISEYETGSQEITDDNIKIITSFFGITKEVLFYYDLSESKKLNEGIDLHEVTRLSKVLFPLFKKEESKKDLLFDKAYDISEKILHDSDTINLDGKVFDNLVEEAIDLYSKSYERCETVESLVNYLTLMIYLYISIVSETKYRQIMCNIKKNNQFSLKEILIYLKHDEEQNIGKNVFAADSIVDILKDIRTVKQHEEYSDYGDYLFAQIIMNGMIDTTGDITANQRIGLQIMTGLALMENKYALNYLIEIKNLSE